jgi:hypothetical protein
VINAERQRKKAIAYQQNTDVKQSVQDRNRAPGPDYLVKIIETASKPERKHNNQAECISYEIKTGISVNIFLRFTIILRLINPFKSGR